MTASESQALMMLLLLVSCCLAGARLDCQRDVAGPRPPPSRAPKNSDGSARRPTASSYHTKLKVALLRHFSRDSAAPRQPLKLIESLRRTRFGSLPLASVCFSHLRSWSATAPVQLSTYSSAFRPPTSRVPRSSARACHAHAPRSAMTTDSSPSLPYPVSASRRRPSHSSPYPGGGNSRRSPSLVGGSWAVLTQRGARSSPLTLLLLGLLAISLLGNLRALARGTLFGAGHVAETTKVPYSIRATLQTSHSELRHLVMVPGHAIWTGCDASTASMDQDWILEEMQRGGDVRAYIKHITKGAELAVRDPSALLIFSGGMTRPASTLSEAMSYYRLAKAGNIYESFMNEEQKVREEEFERVTTEDFALDSFQNVINSVARFREFTGHFPTYITIVGYGMKRRRYEEVHRAALRWPAHAFNYIGIDNDHEQEADYLGERVGGLEPWLQDIYGCKGNLIAKRRKRNPYRRFHPYHTSSPELEGLFEYCPLDNEVFKGELPWDGI